MILCFKFDFSSNLPTLEFFLDFWANKSGLKYSLQKDENLIKLFVQGSNEELINFSDNFISKVPHSIFLKKSEVFQTNEFLEFPKKEFNFKLNLITPHALNSNENEFGFKADEKLISKGIEKLSNGEDFKYGDYTFSLFKDFDCDFLLPTNLNLLPKIFLADEKSLIALASFEKPVINFRTNALFISNHPQSPLNFDVRAAWDINIFRITQGLKNINFLKVKSEIEDFKVLVLENNFIPINKNIFIDKENLAFINSKKDKNLANFALKIKDFNLEEKIVSEIFLSKFEEDHIKVFKKQNDFNLFKISLPDTFEELAKELNEDSKTLLENFKAKFNFPSGKTGAKNNFYSLFRITQKILNYKEDLASLADNFGAKKGVRIDYKFKENNEFDYLALIKSAMSYTLAGADSKNISFGIYESLAYFLSDYADQIKADLECKNFIFSGSLFECKSLANLCVKLSDINFTAKFSEKYPLEIS